MALERAMFLRQQADLIRASELFARTADLITKPGQRSAATDLAREALVAIADSEIKEAQGLAKTKELSEAGFKDIPLDDFARRLRHRPSPAGTGAIVRITQEAGNMAFDDAIAASERATIALRGRDMQGHQNANREADEHIARSEAIVKKGVEVAQELGDIPLEDFLTETLVTTENPADGEKPTETAITPASRPEVGGKLRRGERILKILDAAFGLTEREAGFPVTFDEIVVDANSDRASAFPNEERLAGQFRSATKTDLGRGLEYMSSEEELNKALIDTGVKIELKAVQQKLREVLTPEEMKILAFRQSGWEAVRAKMTLETELRPDEVEPDFVNMPIAESMALVKKSFEEQVPLQVNIDNLPGILDEIHPLLDRIWITSLIPSKDHNDYLRRTQEDIVRYVFQNELRGVATNSAIYDRHLAKLNEGISKISTLMVDALRYCALGKTEDVPPKLEDRFLLLERDRFYQYLYWLSPAELEKAMRRELTYDQVIQLNLQRREAVTTPEGANKFLHNLAGE